MERKIVDTINNPLLYITQPVYPAAKPKMQQTYIRRTSTPKLEAAQVSPVEDTVVEKQMPVNEIAEEITTAPLKKNSIEEKTAPKKSQIEENKQPIETHLKVETEPIKEIIKEKPQPQNHVIPVSQEEKVNVREPVRKAVIKKADKKRKLAKPEPVQSIAEAKPEPVQSIAEPKPEPVQSIAEAKPEPDKMIAESKQEPAQSKAEPKPEPVKNKVEPKKDLISELIKEKLPGFDGIAEGKPFHIQLPINKVVEQPKPTVSEVPEVFEVPEISALSPMAEEDVYSGEILQVDDKESLEKIEAAKEKRRMITTFGIRSSIEKGRKAVAAPKKQPLPSPITINDIKNRIPKGPNAQEDIDQLSQNQQEEIPVLQEPEVKKPRHKTFKEMSVEEKVEYLVNLPIAVPKAKCEIRTRETTINGIVVGYKNGVVQIVQRKKPFRVDLKIEDILSISRKSF